MADDSYQDWPHDLSALQAYAESIIKTWREDKPHSPRDYPSRSWLVDNGCSHLRWILREKHELGTREFFLMLTSAGASTDKDLNIEDVATIERINAYLDDAAECRDWTHRTKRTNRSRINEVLRRFGDDYGDDSLITLANEPSLQPEVRRSFKNVIKDLRNELSSDESVHQYLRATHRFIEWLDRAGRIDYDPMAGLEDEFRWNWNSEVDPLSKKQVRRLWIVAKTDEERVLIIGYCVWGVRTRELPEIHRRQLNLDPEDPVVQFGEKDRKNGLGEVTLMFGLDSLVNLLQTRMRQPDWNGYLFPSQHGDDPYLSARQARRRFKAIAKRANVTINGDTATPKQGRALYFNILAEAETDLLERSAEIAREQGSVDPTTVRDHYLTPAQRRLYRRVFFREKFRQILPDDAYTNYSATYDSSLNEF